MTDVYGVGLEPEGLCVRGCKYKYICTLYVHLNFSQTSFSFDVCMRVKRGGKVNADVCVCMWKGAHN